jgi:hypothetical protein
MRKRYMEVLCNEGEESEEESDEDEDLKLGEELGCPTQ